MKTDVLVLFIHLFRCGGTTFHFALGKAVGNQMGRVHLEQIIKEGRQDHGKKKVLVGHFCYGVHEFVARPHTYATILRHPVDRRVSGFFSGETTEKRLPDLVKAYNGQGRPSHTNIMTKLIAGHDDVSSLPEGYYSIAEQKTTISLLRRAQDNLTKFGFVGLYDHYDDEVNRLTDTFRLPRLDLSTKENVSSYRPSLEEVPQKVKDHIEEFDWADCELYQFAANMIKRLAT